MWSLIRGYDLKALSRHSQFENAINVINIYGSQECRTSKEKIQDNWVSFYRRFLKLSQKMNTFV